MILYTLAGALLLGLLRCRVWIVPLFVIAAVIIQIGVGSEWNFTIWKPYYDAIFVSLVLKMLVANLVAGVIGYGVGRGIAYVMSYLARNFRTPLD